MKITSRRDRSLRNRAAAIGLPILLAAVGCGGDSPASPNVTFGGALQAQAFQTATQIEPNGSRVQVRFRISGGRLAEGRDEGKASGRVCLAGACVDRTIGAFAEGSCASSQTVPAGDARLGLAAAWFDGETAGVDFCVENLTAASVFDITVTDGAARSNVIRTRCVPSELGLFCGSQ